VLVLGGLRPPLSPEVAVCVLDKGAGLIRVMHQMPCDRTELLYPLAALQAIELQRHRQGWRRDYFTVVLKLEAGDGERVWLHLDGRCDRMFVQRWGKGDAVGQGSRLLVKAVDYHLGQKMRVRWEYIELPLGMAWLKMGRKVIARRGAKSSRKSSGKNDMVELMTALEHFLGWETATMAGLGFDATQDAETKRRFTANAAIERKVG
jgi:hypothetical protein